jgi:lysophospholipase L1-like esterase
MRRVPTALATLALTVSALAGTAQATAGTASQPTAAKHASRYSPYVALGDSYSATGLAPLEPGSAGTECGRSEVTYSHLVAKKLKVAKFRDSACSGADTSDFFSKQHDDTPPQLDAVKKGTKLVTMTIGGNDENVFSGLITACAIASTAERANTGSISGDPCKRQYGGSFRKTIRQQTYPNVVKALAAVRKKAPQATVVILGYPQILPAVGVPACYSSVPISMGDVPYLDRIQRTLNKAVERAAKRTGARYVDTSRISVGHDACQPVGTRWIEPLLGAASTPLHPNVAGHVALAEKTLGLLRG